MKRFWKLIVVVIIDLLLVLAILFLVGKLEIQDRITKKFSGANYINKPIYDGTVRKFI